MNKMLTPIASAALIEASHEAIDSIKTAAGLTEGQFAALCMPVLRAFADNVQRLPVSSTAFNAAGGAWEFGLAAAMVTYRYAGTVIFFPTLGAEDRRVLEPQCRYMAFLATLSTVVASVAGSSIVSAGEDEYHPLCCEENLYEWLSTRPSANFAWRVPSAPLGARVGAAIAANFIPKRLLTNFDLRAVSMMYEAISPTTTMNGVESTLARVVRKAVQGVLDHHQTKQAAVFQADVNKPGLSPDEANKVASKIIAVENPTPVANLLLDPPVMPARQAPPGAGNDLASSGSAPMEATSPKSAGASDTSEATSSLIENAPGAMRGAPDLGNDGEEKLARANKVLREWFNALKQHPQFHVLKDQLVINEAGIEVPVSMLGMFGVSGASIRKMMDEAGLILRRSENARGVILHPGLRDRFTSQ